MLGILGGGSAKKLELLIQAKDQASDAIGKVRASIDDTKGAALGLAAGLTAAFAGVAALALKAVKASAEQESGINQLNLALKTAGTSYADASAAIEEFAKQQQAVTRYGDDQTRQVITTLTRITGDFGEATLRAARAVQDLAEAEGMDLSAASRQVGQALEGNLQTLARNIPAMRGLQKEVDAAASSGERHEIVLRALEGRYAGAAAALDPLIQRQARLANATSDLFEAFGKAIIQSGFFNETLGIAIGVMETLEGKTKGSSKEIDALFRSVAPSAVLATQALLLVTREAVKLLQTFTAVVDTAVTALTVLRHAVPVLISPVAGGIALLANMDDALDSVKRAAAAAAGSWGDVVTAQERTDKAFAPILAGLDKVLSRAAAVAEVWQAPWWAPDAAQDPKPQDPKPKAPKGKRGPAAVAQEFVFDLNEGLDIGGDELFNDVAIAHEEAIDRLAAANREYSVSLEEMRASVDQTSSSMILDLKELGDSAQRTAGQMAVAAMESVEGWLVGAVDAESAMQSMAGSVLRGLSEMAKRWAAYHFAMTIGSIASKQYFAAGQHAAAAVAFGVLGAAAGAAGTNMMTAASRKDRDAGTSSASSSAPGSDYQDWRSGAQSGRSGDGGTTVYINIQAQRSYVSEKELGRYVGEALGQARRGGMLPTERGPRTGRRGVT